jgi:tight adherence protein B
VSLSAVFWGTDAVLLGVLAVSFVAVFLVSTFLMGTRARTRRDQALAARFGRRSKKKEQAEAPSGSQFVPEALAQAGRRFAVATGFSGSLDDKLERAGMPIAAGEFVALTVVSTLVGGVVAAIFLLNVIFVLMIAALAGLIPYAWLLRAQRKRKSKLVEQLADTMAILSSSLRAGYSFLQALDTVSKEIGEPSAEEFQRVVAEIRLGRPVEEALAAMAVRIDSDDMKWAVIAINVQRQVGGNLAEVLDTVANTVRERAYVRRQVQVLSAEGRMSVAILSAIPFALFAYISIVNGEYITPLFTTAPGLILLVGGAVFLALGIYIMSRMIKIDV